MKSIAKPETIKKKTGRDLSEWIKIITDKGMDEKSHKEIAAFLNGRYNVSAWWAQELTVLYEKESGRRITGQTKDAGFQIGVSKTYAAEVERLWDIIVNERDLIDVTGGCGEYEITTRREYSHLRMRWKRADWRDASILQVRFTGKESGKTMLTFHQEKLSGPEVREEMKKHWKKITGIIEEMI